MERLGFPHFSESTAEANTVKAAYMRPSTKGVHPKRIRQDLPWIENNGQYAILPDKSVELDTDMILVKTLAGNAVTTLMRRGNHLDVSPLQNGMYVLYTLDQRGKTHRLAFIKKGE